MTRLLRALSLASLALTAACATMEQHDYSAYREHMPRSILVLPPLNESVDVNASYVWLSTITNPVAERGYYVFPVAVVDAFMKDNGMPGPDEMHGVSLEKLRAVPIPPELRARMAPYAVEVSDLGAPGATPAPAGDLSI